jgi:dinuclear metal center YbgI/SA1388 family protein
MTVRELYERICERIPECLSEEWDNDGIMCCPDEVADVERVLITLDVTEEIVDYAADSGFDLIISHHPLVFRPLKSIDCDNHVSRKLIKLIRAGVGVISLHTRADRVRGGVNDCLAAALGLHGVEPLSEGSMARIGHIDIECNAEEFADKVKSALGVDKVIVSDAYNPVYTVALCGGDGKSFIKEAYEAGADTYISGRIGYNAMEEASEIGINLVEAGHYATEFPVTAFFEKMMAKIDPKLEIEVVGSNMLRIL